MAFASQFSSLDYSLAYRRPFSNLKITQLDWPQPLPTLGTEGTELKRLAYPRDPRFRPRLPHRGFSGDSLHPFPPKNAKSLTKPHISPNFCPQFTSLLTYTHQFCKLGYFRTRAEDAADQIRGGRREMEMECFLSSLTGLIWRARLDPAMNGLGYYRLPCSGLSVRGFTTFSFFLLIFPFTFRGASETNYLSRLVIVTVMSRRLGVSRA